MLRRLLPGSRAAAIRNPLAAPRSWAARARHSSRRRRRCPVTDARSSPADTQAWRAVDEPAAASFEPAPWETRASWSCIKANAKMQHMYHEVLIGWACLDGVSPRAVLQHMYHHFIASMREANSRLSFAGNYRRCFV